MDNKNIYKQAVDELTAGNFDQALWALVWTKAQGDENRAKAGYVEARVREITVAQRQERKAARPPLAERIPWRLVSLAGCAAGFAVLNQHVARVYLPNPPEPDWGFYLAGTFGYTLGLLAFPALALLLGRKSVWGIRLAYLLLFIVACISGAEGIPPGASGGDTAAFGYKMFAGLLFVVWMMGLGFLAPANSRPYPNDGLRRG